VRGLPYETDYVLRLIEQIGALIRRALERAGAGDPEQADEQLAGRAIGLALGMDPAPASQLSPQTLVLMLRLGGVDAQVVELVARAIELDAELLEARGDTAAAGARTEQAIAVRALLESSNR
jgi:hypothetical protein